MPSRDLSGLKIEACDLDKAHRLAWCDFDRGDGGSLDLIRGLRESEGTEQEKVIGRARLFDWTSWRHFERWNC